MPVVNGFESIEDGQKRFYRQRGFYERYIKRLLDIICSVLAILVFWWLYVIIAVLIKIKLGSPVLYKQPRPGMMKNGKETIFDMIKFRSMSDERDDNGNLLPDEARLGAFGKMLRATSLDEIPEVINILTGDMSAIGPRPQLVRDMVFMSDKQRMRHTAKPGLTGLAQVMGRNAIAWEDKINWDLKYIEKISFLGDLKIVWMTVRKVFGKGENSAELDITDDYGDALLKAGKVSQAKYDALQAQARNLIDEHNGVKEKITR